MIEAVEISTDHGHVVALGMPRAPYPPGCATKWNCRRRTFVNLWHGDGPKMSKRFANVHSTFVVAGTRLWGDQRPVYFGVDEAGVLVTGNPRIDQFARPVSDEQLQALGLDPARPFILWMPTYRKTEYRGRRLAKVRNWADAEELIRELIRQIVAPYGVKAEVDYVRGVPPVVNEAASTQLLGRAAELVVGEDCHVPTRQSLGGEDFAWYLESVPGAMARLGTRTPGGPTYDLHQGDLRVDERATPIGAKVLGAAALAGTDTDFFVTVSSRITGVIGSSSNPISGMTIATLILTCTIFVALGWGGRKNLGKSGDLAVRPPQRFVRLRLRARGGRGLRGGGRGAGPHGRARHEQDSQRRYPLGMSKNGIWKFMPATNVCPRMCAVDSTCVTVLVSASTTSITNCPALKSSRRTGFAGRFTTPSRRRLASTRQSARSSGSRR